MIDKCANPECDERLVYLRSGVLYAVDLHQAANDGGATHYFWMCEPCSSRYKLHFNRLGEPEIVPVAMRNAAYHAEVSERSVYSILINPSRRTMPEPVVTAESELRPAVSAVASDIRNRRKVRCPVHVAQQACA